MHVKLKEQAGSWMSFSGFYFHTGQDAKDKLSSFSHHRHHGMFFSCSILVFATA